MQIGSWKVTSLLEGTFLLDGGSMFGVVPKPLWSRRHPVDERNRMTMALRPMLISGEGRHILVDCGIGQRFSPKQQGIFQYQQENGGLPGALKRMGLGPEDITDVIATHLHFDHVGGLLTRDANGKLRPVFPRARVYAQEECWAWARGPSVWDQASFFVEDFDAWENLLDLQLLQGDSEIAENVRVKVTSGHTPGQQIVVVGEGSQSLVHCADLIPTASHVNLPYIMAFDHLPLVTLEEKKILLALALEEGWVLVFGHDRQVAAGRLQEKDGRVVLGEQLDLNSSQA